MVDDLKKKKADRERVSLTQKHEVRALKNAAKDILKKLRRFKDSETLEIIRFDKLDQGIHHKIKQVLSIRRICKALLKCLK